MYRINKGSSLIIVVLFNLIFISFCLSLMQKNYFSIKKIKYDLTSYDENFLKKRLIKAESIYIEENNIKSPYTRQVLEYLIVYDGEKVKITYDY